MYDALWERGRAFGIANYGLYAVNSMRIEKGYKAWSTELTNELNMLEADMARFFNAEQERLRRQGRDARAAAAPFADRLSAEIDATDTDARGGEPVLAADRCIGITTSGSYGHRVDKSLAFACVELAFAAPGSVFDVLIQGERRRAQVLGAAAFDADNARMRA